MRTPFAKVAAASILASLAFLGGRRAAPTALEALPPDSRAHDPRFWIDVVTADGASGKLRRIYEQFRGPEGVDHMIMAHSPSLKVLMHLDLHGYLFLGSSDPLGPFVSARLAAAVADEIGSVYVRTHFADTLLGGLGVVATDIEVARLTRPHNAREAAMIRFVRKLADRPHAMTRADVAQLRGVGLDDRQILRVALIGSYINLTSRVALGLGVPLEPYWTSDS